MKYKVFSGWDFMRVLRLAMGIFIVIDDTIEREWSVALAGAVFAIMPLLNVGCFGNGTCSVSAPKNRKNSEVKF